MFSRSSLFAVAVASESRGYTLYHKNQRREQLHGSKPELHQQCAYNLKLHSLEYQAASSKLMPQVQSTDTLFPSHQSQVITTTPGPTKRKTRPRNRDLIKLLVTYMHLNFYALIEILNYF